VGGVVKWGKKDKFVIDKRSQGLQMWGQCLLLLDYKGANGKKKNQLAVETVNQAIQRTYKSPRSPWVNTKVIPRSLKGRGGERWVESAQGRKGVLGKAL